MVNYVNILGKIKKTSNLPVFDGYSEQKLVRIDVDKRRNWVEQP